jgi:hypothetical protein
MLTLCVLIAALVCFLLATFGVPRTRVHCGWLGAALFTVASIIAAWPAATA